MSHPSDLVGVRVLVSAPSQGGRQAHAGDALLLTHPGLVVLDLGGPEEVVGVRIDAGPLVFRRLSECRILAG